jgi:hypothetical protein
LLVQLYFGKEFLNNEEIKMLAVELVQASVRHGGVVNEPLPLPQFNLDYVRDQLLQEHSKMSDYDVDDALRKYRNFLALCKEYPDLQLMPCHKIDMVWHKHMLNTKRYQADCSEYFGKYLNHKPGMPSQEVADQSRELYMKHFGIADGYHKKCMVMCCRTD